MDSAVKVATEPEEILITGDFETTGASNVVPVTVTSNRSWSARFQGDFAELNDNDGLIVDGTPTKKEFTVSFTQNPTNKAREGVIEIFAEGEIRARIPVTQHGQVYRLKAAASKLGFDEEGGISEITIDSNAPWTARIEDTDGMGATLDRASGSGGDIIKVTVPPCGISGTKSATVILSAEDCEDVRLTITQISVVLKKFGSLSATFTSGRSGVGLVPLFIINNDTEGASFRYEIGTSSFGTVPAPGPSSKTVPAAGLDFLPSGYQVSAVSSLYTFYLKVLASAPDYKDAEYNILIRVWSFGQKAIYNKSTGGLTISGTAGGKQPYYIRFAEADKTTMSVSTTTSTGGIVTAAAKYHNKNLATQIQFKSGNEVRHTVSENDIPADSPRLVVAPSCQEEKGQTVSLVNPGTSSNYPFLWSYILMEEVRL